MNDMMNPLKQYPDLERHWCPLSEPYTGCDSLISALQAGWKLGKVGMLEIHQRQYRHVLVYHFMLYHADELIIMRVVESPAVQRVIMHYEVKITRRTDDVLLAALDEETEQDPMAHVVELARR